MSKICQICGKKSGIYPLCVEHLQLKSKGEVIKCEKCGKWHLKNEKHECNNNISLPHLNSNKNKSDSADLVNNHKCKKEISNSLNKCIVCGTISDGKNLCIDCYKYKEEAKKNFDRNRRPDQIKLHYFNLKDTIYKFKNAEYIKNTVLRLMAMSEDLKLLHNDDYLKDRLIKDVEFFIKKININKKDNLTNENIQVNQFDEIDFRKQWPAEHQCEDGHYVRSLSELLIDNWLYTHNYIHSYEKSVFMPENPNETVLSDFYIKNGNVYIEFWGLDNDQQYLERKEKKKKLYGLNNYSLINLKSEDIKRLNDILPRKLFEYTKNKK